MFPFFQETNPANDFGLQDVTSDGKRDFSNPMYDAYGQLESQATADAVNYSIPSGEGSGSWPPQQSILGKTLSVWSQKKIQSVEKKK